VSIWSGGSDFGAKEAVRRPFKHHARQTVRRVGHRIDTDAVAPDDDVVARGVSMHNDPAVSAPGSEKLAADPQQVARLLLVEGPSRANAGMHEEVIVDLVDQCQPAEKCLVPFGPR